MLKVVTVGATTLFACMLCATPLSLRFAPEGNVSLSVDSASAEIGRPLTPMSVAGVNRRAHRRAYRQEYYGYGANYGPYRYGYGTYQPYWGWGAAGVAAGAAALAAPYNDNYFGGVTYQGGPRSAYTQRSYWYGSPYRNWTQF